MPEADGGRAASQAADPAERPSAESWLASRTLVIGLGLEKAGTTSLWNFLRRHPEVSSAARKEFQFFNRYWDKGLDWYVDQFDPEGARVILDITPEYYRTVEALSRIAELPTTKRYLLMMRHPVQRSFSYYLHQYYHHISRGEGGYGDYTLPWSFYEILERRFEWLFTTHQKVIERVLGSLPGEHVLFLTMEELLADLPGQRARLARHIGIDEQVLPTTFPRSNALQIPRFAWVDVARAWDSGIASVPLPRVGLYRFENGVPIDWVTAERPIADLILRRQDSLTLTIDAAACEAIHERLFAADCAYVSATLGLDTSAWQPQRSLQATYDEPFTPPSEAIDPRTSMAKVLTVADEPRAGGMRSLLRSARQRRS